MNEDVQRHVDLLRVLDGSGNVLWDSGASAASPLHIANSYRQVGGQMHNSYGSTQFGGALTASTIRLEVSAYDPDPTDGDAASAFKIAIDNIQFSQPLVPEPTSLALLGLDALALLRRRGWSSQRAKSSRSGQQIVGTCRPLFCALPQRA